MKKMTAKDLMTREVIVIPHTASFREVVETLYQNRISGAPVVESHGRIVGVVSESDIIEKIQSQPRIPRISIFGLWPVPEDLVEEAMKSLEGLTAEDLMTAPPHAITEDTPVEEIADKLMRFQINRLPVVNAEGRPIGIVTRHDLLKAFLEPQA